MSGENTQSTHESATHEAKALKEATFSSTLGAFVKTVRPQVIAGVVLTSISSICTFIPFVVLARIATYAIEVGTPTVSWLIPHLVVAAISALFGRLLFGIGTGVCHYADAQFRVNVRTALAEQVSRIPLGWFTAHGAGEIKQASNDDVIGMHQIVAHAPADMTAGILSPVLALIYIFATDWKMGVFVLIWIIIAMMFSSLSMLGDFASLNSKYNTALAEVSNATVEMVDGIEVVKTYGAGSGASKRFRKAVDDYINITYIWAKQTGAPFSLSQALMSPPVMLVLLTFVSILFMHLGWITLSEAVVLLIFGTGVPSAIINVWGTAGFLRTAATSAEHFGSIMDIEPLPEPTDSKNISTENIDVKIDDVHFSYTDGASFSINGVNIDVAPNTVTALVGQSGSGKTTIARLIPRFWDVQQGSVSLAGTDVRDASSVDVLARCGVVFQETQLLRMTLAENIALAKPDATHDEIVHAAQLANIHERILELPQGYDSIPGTQGVNLSGGEAQRIAIARAILADTPILILDEATAHADPENEALIQDALAQLVKDRATIVIAHRLNTIRHAHQIVVMNEGAVAERGTHDELLQQGGIYAHMWESQEVKVSVK